MSLTGEGLCKEMKPKVESTGGHVRSCPPRTPTSQDDEGVQSEAVSLEDTIYLLDLLLLDCSFP